jgi:anti-sigma regulatory factor (Ser/Thr protein kinase)
MTGATAELSIRAESGEARRAAAWLEQSCAASGVPAEHLARLDHCLDEALANVVAHGGAGARAAPVLLRLGVHSAHDFSEAAVTVTDAGNPFDPLAAPPAARPASLAEAEPGGLGVVMLRSYADRLSYRHHDGRNHLTFAVRWREA